MALEGGELLPKVKDVERLGMLPVYCSTVRCHLLLAILFSSNLCLFC